MPRPAPFDPSCPQRALALLNPLQNFHVNGCCFYGAISHWVPPCHALSTACMAPLPNTFPLDVPFE